MLTAQSLELMSPALNAESNRRIKLELGILNPAAAFAAVAVRTRHQAIERVIDFPQSRLEQLAVPEGSPGGIFFRWRLACA